MAARNYIFVVYPSEARELAKAQVWASVALSEDGGLSAVKSACPVASHIELIATASPSAFGMSQQRVQQLEFTGAGSSA